MRAQVNKEDALRFIRAAKTAVTDEVAASQNVNIGISMAVESITSNVPKVAALDFLDSLEKAIELFQTSTNLNIDLNIAQHGGLDAQILAKTKEAYEAAKKIEEVSKPALVASSAG